MLRQTHTVVTLGVPKKFFAFVFAKLKEAGYDHAFFEDDKAIDMQGIALVEDAEADKEPDFQVNPDKGVAVGNHYFLPMSTCPRGVKVQLLGPGDMPGYGAWNGSMEEGWKGWYPLPDIPDFMRDPFPHEQPHLL